jgi:hypothetical protein
MLGRDVKGIYQKKVFLIYLTVFIDIYLNSIAEAIEGYPGDIFISLLCFERSGSFLIIHHFCFVLMSVNLLYGCLADYSAINAIFCALYENFQ